MSSSGNDVCDGEEDFCAKYQFVELISFLIRTDTYQEQPIVSFKYDYILIVKTKERDPIFCSNIHQVLQFTQGHSYCSLVKGQEDDINNDGKKDVLNFTLQMALPDTESVHGATLLLFFDYRLTGYCRVQMEAMGVLQHSSAVAGAGLSFTADLNWAQRQPLPPRRLDKRYNVSVVPTSSVFSLPHVLTHYSYRNWRGQLTNVYPVWTTGRAANELFTLHTTVYYAEATVRFTPTLWQRLHDCWVQLFPVLVIFVLLFRTIKNFIFSNHLVYTYKDVPWKKDY